jgi:hypothetical protein
VLRVRCLHGYHGAVPPMTLIAPFARVTRSHEPVHASPGRPPSATYRTLPPPEEGKMLLTAEPLDLDYEHEVIRRVDQESD